jgi:hypothetical protein
MEGNAYTLWHTLNFKIDLYQTRKEGELRLKI